MGQANTLRLMLDRLAVNDGCLENLRNTSMNSVTLHIKTISNPVLHEFEGTKGRKYEGNGQAYKIFNGAARSSEHDGLRVIWLLALGLCVHSNQAELVPHGLHQLINVPSVLRADGNSIGDSVQKIELLNTDRINLVQAVNNGDVTIRSKR